MPAFPLLDVSPTLPIPRKPRSNAIKSEAEAGYVQARPRFSRKTSDFGPLDYPVLLAGEKDQIQSLFDEVGETVLFTWTMPRENTVHNVRFKEPPVFKLVGLDIWACNFSLEEA